MKNVIAYVRQSAQRGEETSETSLSLQAQESYIRNWAKKEGLPVRSVHKDHDLRGNDPNRPALQAAIADLQVDDVFAVYDLSRLARDNVLQEQIYRQIVAQGAALVSATEPHAGDDLYRGLLGVINQEFRRQHGRRVASNIEAKVRRGQFHARPPFGYSKENGKLVPNEYAPVVKEIFEMVATGKAYFAVATEMYERFGGNHIFRWDHRNIENIIHRWTYSGAVTWHDEIIWCDDGPCHPPIVDRALQERAIEMAANRSRTTVKRKGYGSALEGKVIHECGSAAYLRIHGRHHELKLYGAFSCTTMSNTPKCTVERRTISDRKLEVLMVEALQADLATLPEVMDDVLELTEENYERQLPDTNRRRKELMTQKSDLIKRNERVVNLYTDGVRDRQWMLDEVGKIDAEVKQIDHELTHLPAPVDPALIGEFARVMGAHRNQLTFLSVEQASVILDTVGQVMFGPSGVQIVYREPYSYLFPNPTRIPITTANPHLRKRDRNQKTFGPQREYEATERKRKARQKHSQVGK